GRGLAGTVDAGHQDNERLRGDLEWPRDRRERFLDFVGQKALPLVGREALRVATLAQRVDDPYGHILSEIGAYQFVLECIERLRLARPVRANRRDGATKRG